MSLKTLIQVNYRLDDKDLHSIGIFLLVYCLSFLFISPLWACMDLKKFTEVQNIHPSFHMSSETQAHQFLLAKKTIKKKLNNQRKSGRTYTKHARQRMKQRGVSKKSVEEAINKGTARKGNKKGTIEYHLSSKHSSIKKGLKVVTDKKGNVITVINMGANYKGIQ